MRNGTDPRKSTIYIYQSTPNQPWNQKRLQYLFRRLAYGIPLRKQERLLESSPEKIIDYIIDKAIRPSYTPAPKWADWTIKNYKKINGNINDKLVEKHAEEWASATIKGMQKKGFREKVVLFWSNHFVTAFWNYESPLMLRNYHKVLQKYALGNFKEFVQKIGLTPAMLIYLDGIENSVEQPNENYARELLELFTLGRDNGYSQKDIAEIARGQKTIFGKTGNWNYDDVIDLLFEEKGQFIAKHICREIYQAFVYHEADESIVNELAKTFIHHDFELAPVFRQLFKSEHFFSDEIIGTQIKSPLDLMLTFINELDIKIDDDEKYFELFESGYWTGQALFNPPDVSGWKGQHTWIDATKLTRRWEVLEGILYEGIGDKNIRTLITFTKKITNETKDPAIIVKTIVDYFLPKGLQTAADYERAVEKFKEEWPKDVFKNGWWNLDREDTEWQVAALITYLFRLPEFHLC
jgi:uncharacterized protein (DUF1800 family)